jgi:hypothetical protein
LGQGLYFVLHRRRSFGAVRGREDFAEIELADKEKQDICGRSFFYCRLVEPVPDGLRVFYRRTGKQD